MRQRKGSLSSKILWLVAGGVILVAGVVFALANHPKQMPGTKAVTTCQGFYDEVKANILAMDGYSILDSKKSCTPNVDEAGGTDYYFDVLFRLSKAGNETVEGITANSKYLVDHYPRTTYPIWARNDAAIDGRPDTICFAAAMQLQEDGKAYSSYPENHYYTDYTKPGSLPSYKPCDGL